MTENKTIAKIKKAELGFEDHDIFGFNIDFQLGTNSYQGTGWYFLSNDHGAKFLEAILRAVGARRWSDLEGKTVFVIHDEGGAYNSLIKGIEKLPTETQGGRLIFDEFFEAQGIKR